MKHQLGAAVGIAAIISAAGSALAADLPPRAAAPAYLAQGPAGQPGMRSRPPSAFALSDRDAILAVAATQPYARDNHVLEFLRWKAQHTPVR